MRRANNAAYLEASARDEGFAFAFFFRMRDTPVIMNNGSDESRAVSLSMQLVVFDLLGIARLAWVGRCGVSGLEVDETLMGG